MWSRELHLSLPPKYQIFGSGTWAGTYQLDCLSPALEPSRFGENVRLEREKTVKWK